MFQKIIKNIRHPLVANSFSLYVAHFSDYLLALIVLPFIARVLGPAELGRIGLAQTFGILILLIMEFGFSLTATREISQNRGDKTKVARIIAEVFTFKLFLLPFIIIISALVMLLIPLFRQIPIYVLIVVVGSIAQGLIPTWYYQGMEKLRVIAVSKIIFRSLGFLVIIVLVKSPQDGWIVLTAYTITSLGLFIYLFVNMLNLSGKFALSSWNTVKSTWIDSKHSFLITILPSITNNMSVFILSVFVSPLQLGFYYGAARIHRAFNSLFSPLGDAFYPHLTSNIDQSHAKAKIMTMKFMGIMVSLGLGFSLFIFLFTDPLIEVLLGPKFLKASTVLKVFAGLLPLTAVTHVLGRQWMVGRRLDSHYAGILIYAGLIGLGSFMFLIKKIGISALPTAFIISESATIILILFKMYNIKKN